MNKETRIFIWGLFLIFLGGFATWVWVPALLREEYTWINWCIAVAFMSLTYYGYRHVKKVI